MKNKLTNEESAMIQKNYATIRIMVIDYIKHITTISGILIPFLVVLHKQVPHNILLLQVVTVLLLSCLLSGVSLLKTQIGQQRKSHIIQLEQIKAKWDGVKLKTRTLPYEKRLLFLETICLASFGIALSLLVVSLFLN